MRLLAGHQHLRCVSNIRVCARKSPSYNVMAYDLAIQTDCYHIYHLLAQVLPASYM